MKHDSDVWRMLVLSGVFLEAIGLHYVKEHRFGSAFGSASKFERRFGVSLSRLSVRHLVFL
ncbi:MAG: hypothetical protein ACKO6B_17295, partial [Planctomycetia bacterium]